MSILRRMVVTFVFLLTASACYGGELGSGVPWIFDWTRPYDLDRNNDDYVGEFDNNVNRFSFEGFGLPGSNGSERLVPTIPSEGITEYALTIGGGGINFDNVYELQLGFGSGDSFVPASEVTSGLRFDLPETVSPPIEDTAWFVDEPYPMLEILDHQSDMVRFRGSSDTGRFRQYSFSMESMLRLPIDIPDLSLSVREFYTPEQLGAMPTENDRPFTVQMRALFGNVDVDQDSLVGAGDVDSLTTAIIAGQNDEAYDLDLNGVVDRVDRDVWVRSLVHTFYGDANLDREFDSSDFVKVFKAGEYEDAVFFNSTWEEGDWNGDKEFTSRDIVVAFQDGGFESGRRRGEVDPEPVSMVVIPEPSTWGLSLIAITVLRLFKRKRPHYGVRL